MTQSGSSIPQGDPGDENDAKGYHSFNPFCDNPVCECHERIARENALIENAANAEHHDVGDALGHRGDWTLEQTQKADEWFARQGVTLPTDSEARKGIPITTGVLDYFPAALAAVAAVSKAGNDKHNPGEPLHWARGKSMDQADCIGRHLIERGGVDPETGMRHSAQLAWRALALLQLELEEAGEAPLARGAY